MLSAYAQLAAILHLFYLKLFLHWGNLPSARKEGRLFFFLPSVLLWRTRQGHRPLHLKESYDHSFAGVVSPPPTHKALLEALKPAAFSEGQWELNQSFLFSSWGFLNLFLVLL